MEQVQCSNCGGNKVSHSIHTLDKRTGKPVYRFDEADITKLGMGCVGFFGLFFAVTALIMFDYAQVEAFDRFVRRPLIALLAAALFFSVYRLAKWTANKETELERNLYVEHTYHCDRCGYHWTMRVG